MSSNKLQSQFAEKYDDTSHLSFCGLQSLKNMLLFAYNSSTK